VSHGVLSSVGLLHVERDEQDQRHAEADQEHDGLALRVRGWCRFARGLDVVHGDTSWKMRRRPRHPPGMSGHAAEITDYASRFPGGPRELRLAPRGRAGCSGAGVRASKESPRAAGRPLGGVGSATMAGRAEPDPSTGRPARMLVRSAGPSTVSAPVSQVPSPPPTAEALARPWPAVAHAPTKVSASRNDDRRRRIWRTPLM
jgi:hypothetical protein